MSLSARRAWIEIENGFAGVLFLIDVALRKESVDRNKIRIATIDSIIDVALRKESVDRNTQRRDFKRLGLLSLSARRAWIEIDAPSSAP